jgi:hypothetical protein
MPPPTLPEGWYPDPKDDGQERFWDGKSWTDKTAPKKTSANISAPVPSTPKPTGAATAVPPKKGGIGCGMGCLIVVGIIVVLGIIIGVASAIGGSNNSSDPANNDDLAIVTCQDVVTQNLKSPSTASFPEVPTISGDTITGEVDAQNGFGATIRADFQCTRDGDKVSLDFLNNR